MLPSSRFSWSDGTLNREALYVPYDDKLDAEANERRILVGSPG